MQLDMQEQEIITSMKELNMFQKVSFQSWPLQWQDSGFKHRTVKVPHEILDYLQQDGVGVQHINRAIESPSKWDDCDQWTDEGSEGEENGVQIDSTILNDFKSQIDQCIKELGGCVIPKLNWSASIDSMWVSCQGLKCSNADEVLLLLKCSDRISNDIEIIQQVQSECPDFESVLVLKKWGNLRPEREFRCFVRDRELCGISQRQTNSYFPQLEEQKCQIQSQIENFHYDSLLNNERFPLKDFVYDVYVTSTNLKVILMDVNVVGGSTQPLLFEWDKIYGQIERNKVDFRLVSQENQGVMCKGQAILYGVPYEFAQGDESQIQNVADQARQWWAENCR
eukprot:TRINITY_DN4762_c0_g2_i1.p1 TRINITY_DN4762_c0_g2~~TRINITY_DN4762_c0_g2_i1.p1  ORF type:complete len:338 (-),score=30.74 TRINITY_DN4762_c0_g2_i1:125-1138(-)